jgi:hypothetical protein
VQAGCDVKGFLDFFYVGMVLIVYYKYIVDIPSTLDLRRMSNVLVFSINCKLISDRAEEVGGPPLTDHSSVGMSCLEI